MYLSSGSSLEFKNKDVLAVYLTDFFKTTTLIFNLNLFDGKMFSVETIPNVLKKHIKILEGNDIFEIISLVDFINEIYESTKKMKDNLSNTKALIIDFPNVDFSVYANKDSHFKKIIFEEYKTIKYIYEEIINTRKIIENTKKVKKNNEILNFTSIYERLSKYTESPEAIKFFEDFKHLSSKEISIAFKNKFLNAMNETECNALQKNYPCAIFEKKYNYLSPIYYSFSLKTKSNGMLSDFSNYIYFLNNHDKFFKEFPSYISELKSINNSAILEKIFHLKEDSKKLENFIGTIVNKNFIKTLLKSGNVNELVKLIDENDDLFTDNNNESIFIACLLIQVKSDIKKKRVTIEKDLMEIIVKKVDLEYRMAEIEMYIRQLMFEILDNKRLYNLNEELDKIFYGSINRICYEIIYKCFDDSAKEDKEDIKEEVKK